MHTSSTSVRSAPPIGYTHGNALNRRSLALSLVVIATLIAAAFLFESKPYVEREESETPFNAKATGGHWPYIVTLGDSITEYGWDAGNNGWVGLLAGHYIRHADVHNRGFSGYTTRNILSIIHNLFPLGASSAIVHHPPELVTIFFGANDAVLKGSWVRSDGTDQHVPLPEYGDNLLQIINHLRTIKQSLPLILIAPPPTVTADVGDKAKVPVIDTWALMHGDDPEEFPTYLNDGLHFNDRGNSALFDAVRRTIADYYPTLSVPDGGRLPVIGPPPA